MSQYGWDRPSLDRVRNAVLDAGKRASPMAGNYFRCQCPAHDGDGLNAVIKLQSSGKISFTCYSNDCSLQALMDSLDLVHSDFYPPDLNPLKRTYREPSHDAALCMVAKNDLEQGKKLTASEMENYQMALVRLYGSNGAA